jgi:integrase
MPIGVNARRRSAARISEITGMRRDELTLEHGRVIWRCPRDRAKKGNIIVRPLSRMALAILMNRLDGADSQYVFASPFTADRRVVAKVPTRAIERAAKLGLVPPNFSSHDIRRTAETNWAALGIPEQITRKLVGHVVKRSDTLGRHYDKYSYIPEMLQALRRWERRLLEITAPRKTAPSHDAGVLAAGERALMGA